MRHSVVLDFKKCRGCTTCIKNCPTEAIRVRSGKATILPNRCIDCGTCIRVCPHKAVKSVCDDFSALKNYRYTIAIPDPALYGQFQNLDDVDIVLNGLLELGFDHVYEASAACEMLSGFARERILKESDRPMPEISPACPAVVRLISIRFPKLINHIAPVITPSEFAAITARQQAVKDTGLSPDEIGVFSIVPCSSLVTAAHSPVGLAHPVLDGAFAIRDVYLALLGPMKKLDKDNLKPLSASGILGVGWAYVGGCLNVENPFGARMRLKKLMRDLPVSRTRFVPGGPEQDILQYTQKPEDLPSLPLDPDRGRAMEKMFRIQELEKQLPGLRCGSCGAPSCHAFAEDVVMGRASVDDCIFKMRERMQHMAGNTAADEYLPAPFRRRKEPLQDEDFPAPEGSGAFAAKETNETEADP